MKKLQIIILLSFLSMAAKAQVVADYTYTTSLCGPYNVSFLDTSLGGGFQITSWAWDLGDGQTSTVQSPSNVYTSAGTYNVCLTATNSNGQSDTECKMIELTTPVADAGPDMELNCVNTSVTLDGSGSSQGTSLFYNWTTFNGNILTGANTLNPEVDAAGDYTIIVTDAQTGCTAESTVTVTVNAFVPSVSIATPPVLTCLQSNVLLDATGSSQGANYSYLWSNTSTIILTEVNAPGTYSLTVTDNINGCTAASSVVVEEDMEAPTCNISVSPGNLGCTTVTLDGTGSSTGSNFEYLWTTTNGVIVSGNTTLTPEVEYDGTYDLTITNTDNGCTSQCSFEVQPNSNLPTFSLPNTSLCEGEMVSLTVGMICSDCTIEIYDPNGMQVCNSLPCSFTPINGTYSFTVTDNTNGCSNTDNFTITVSDEIVLSSVVTDIVCYGNVDGAIDLTVVGGTTPYEFNWSDGSLAEDISVASAGIYTVTVVDANGCFGVHEATISEPSELVLNTTSTPASCNGGSDGSIDLSVTGGSQPYTYVWSPGFWITQNLQTLGAGTYTVTVTDNNGCTATEETVVEEASTLNLFMTNDTTICMGESVELEVNWIPNVAYPVQWSPTTGLSTPNSNITIATPTETTTYSVTITDSNGCLATEEVTVTVNNYLDFGLQLFSNSPVCEGEPLEFYSNLSGAANYFWNGPNGFFSTEANPVIPVADASMTGGYSLEIIDNAGCNTGATFNVLVDDDCVWPGDTDTNKVVNNFDLLNIGLAFDSVGPSRFGGSLSWMGQAVEDWSQSTPTSNVNFKHADTDGNGIVNADDTLAITQNWGLMHNFTGNEVLNQFTDLPPVSDGSVLNAPFYVEPDSLPEGETIGLDIILGDMSNVVTGLYGIAFSIEYDTSVVVAGSASIDFNNCWLGDINADAITIQRDFPAQGRIDAAITRIDGMEMDGAGLFGEFIITLDDDILLWDTRNDETDNDVFANFTITNYHLINFSQEEILVEATTTSAPVSGTTSIHNTYLDKEIQLYPNPANELFFISSSKNLFIEEVKIYSTTNLIKAIKTKTNHVIEIPTMDLPNGIYFIELQTERGVVTKKISVMK